MTLACEDSRSLSKSHATSHTLTSCFDSHDVAFFKLYWAFCQSMSLDSFIHPVTRIKSYDLFWHLFIWSFTCIPQRAYLCIHMHIYIYLSSCQSINLSFQSHLMIVVRWVLCLWEQQSIWIALPSGLAVPSCICIFPCIGICQFLYFWSFLQTCRYNCWKYTMLFRYCDFMGPRLFGLYPNGQFTFGLFMIGLSTFGLPMMFGLSPFGLF